MHDLPNAVEFSGVESYVDDTKIFLSFSSKDVDLSGKNHLRPPSCRQVVLLKSTADLIPARLNSLCLEPGSF